MPPLPFRSSIPWLRALAAAALALASACQPLPHPLAESVPPPLSPLLKPRDSAGIVVLPIAGAPQAAGAALAEAMAAALRDAEIPAGTRSGNKGSYRLSAAATEREVEAGRSLVAVEWELRGADGTVLGQVPVRAEEATAAWSGGDPAVAKEIAAAAAPAIARLVQDEPPQASGASDPTLRLGEVTGAPGDGGRSLMRAMDGALRRAHVALAAAVADQGSFVLAGSVRLSPPASGQQKVSVSWALSGADGHEIGRVDQENAVPAGSLDGAWGDVAYAVANAAAPGVVALIERAKAGGTGS